MVRKIAVAVALTVIGCEKMNEVTTAPDQCLRREIFMQCLAAVPKGPEKVSDSNDWDEVIDSCASAAHYQSLRRVDKIKEECRP
jgi:hypothetical protein